ncbi:hypothetical protein PANDA_017723 [Ailuropoda melanoleuca]|uniref:Uncharacterized protein n=1 Tax=Ailuropoda melanoleuca TaxID=9646 RepID=D2HYD5_AILME|nr:hypothetical protein PANDA_017723 [Ailuropoda melanoleuca]
MPGRSRPRERRRGTPQGLHPLSYGTELEQPDDPIALKAAADCPSEGAQGRAVHFPGHSTGPGSRTAISEHLLDAEDTPELQPVKLINKQSVGLLKVFPSQELVKRGKFKVCPGDVPYPLGAPEFEGSSAGAFHLRVSAASSQKGWYEGIRKGLGLLQLLSVEARLAHSSEFSNVIQKTEFHRQHHLLQVSPQRAHFLEPWLSVSQGTWRELGAAGASFPPVAALTPAAALPPVAALPPAAALTPAAALPHAAALTPGAALTPVAALPPAVALTLAAALIPVAALTPAAELPHAAALTPGAAFPPAAALTQGAAFTPAAALTPGAALTPTAAVPPGAALPTAAALTPAKVPSGTDTDSAAFYLQG